MERNKWRDYHILQEEEEYKEEHKKSLIFGVDESIENDLLHITEKAKLLVDYVNGIQGGPQLLEYNDHELANNENELENFLKENIEKLHNFVKGVDEIKDLFVKIEKTFSGIEKINE